MSFIVKMLNPFAVMIGEVPNIRWLWTHHETFSDSVEPEEEGHGRRLADVSSATLSARFLSNNASSTLKWEEEV